MTFLALPMRAPRTAGPPCVEDGGSAGAVVALLRVIVRLARVGRVVVGSDCGGDGGTPDSCSWSVTCRRVLAMVSKVELERTSAAEGVP